MDDICITVIAQVGTTLLTVAVTILVAYLTYSAQRRKELEALERLHDVNRRSALKLFRAYISNLIFFVPPKEVKLETEMLRACIEKMKVTDQYLSEMTEADFPDDFLEDFHWYRLNLAFRRIILENKLKDVSDATVSSSLFDDLDLMQLITTIKETINSYSEKNKPEKV